jgi:hypothetical protein
MLLLMTVFAGLVFAAVRYGDLPVGRALHAVLIVGPAAWLLKTPPRRIAIILLLLIGAGLVWVELGPMLLALDFSPVLWFADMSLYLDALLLAATAVAVVQVRTVGRLIAGGVRRMVSARTARPRARARSSLRRQRRQPPPANDDAPAYPVRRAA